MAIELTYPNCFNPASFNYTSNPDPERERIKCPASVENIDNNSWKPYLRQNGLCARCPSFIFSIAHILSNKNAVDL